MSERGTNADIVKVSRAVDRVAADHGISRQFLYAESLVDGGMTSLAMVELMLAMERDFDLRIPDKELTPVNFATIDSIASMLARLSMTV